MTSPISSIAGNTLAIDTSGAAGSIALGQSQVTWDKKAVHSELATVKLGELLHEAGVGLQQITHITVNAGPGSFTGIRVGVNLARTLSYSLKIPIFAFNSLALLAFKYGNDTSIFVAVKAIQNFYYAAGFTKNLAESLAPCSVANEQLADLSRSYQNILIEGANSDFSPALEAKVQLEWLVRRPEATNFSTWKEVRPVYIRASEAEEKLLKGLLKA